MMRRVFVGFGSMGPGAVGRSMCFSNQLAVDIAYSVSETPHYARPNGISLHRAGFANPIESGGHLGLSQGLPGHRATLSLQTSSAGAGPWLAWDKR